MKHATRLATALALCIGLTGGAYADVLVGNSPYLNDISGQQSDGNSTVYSQTFARPSNTTLEAIRWWGYHGLNSMGAGYDNFVVTLDGNTQTGTLSSNIVDKSLGLVEYTLDIEDIALTTSTLSIANDSFDVEWYWQSTSAQGNPDAPDADAVAFSLIGRLNGQTPSTPIPEPGSFSLLLLAMAALGLRKTRRTITSSRGN